MTNFNWLNALKTTSLQEAMGVSDREYHRWLKSEYKEHSQYAAQRDKLAHSLADGEMWQRTVFDADCEGWKSYGFMGFDPEDAELASDGEIDEWFEDNMAVRISFGYDCTGKAFTRYIHWHRNPNGTISYVHAMALDV